MITTRNHPIGNTDPCPTAYADSRLVEQDGCALTLISTFRRGTSRNSRCWPSLLLWRPLLQFGVQVNCAPGDVEGFAPVGEAFLFDDYLMASGSDGDRRGRVADKRSVNFNIRAGRRGFDRDRGLDGSLRGGRSGFASAPDFPFCLAAANQYTIRRFRSTSGQ